jgi:hypothetical protein
MAASDDKKHRPGQLPVHFWVDEAKKKDWQEFADGEGKSLREVIIEAMARHLLYPPPRPKKAEPPVAPLPDAPKRKAGRPKKESGNNS